MNLVIVYELLQRFTTRRCITQQQRQLSLHHRCLSLRSSGPSKMPHLHRLRPRLQLQTSLTSSRQQFRESSRRSCHKSLRRSRRTYFIPTSSSSLADNSQLVDQIGDYMVENLPPIPSPQEVRAEAEKVVRAFIGNLPKSTPALLKMQIALQNTARRMCAQTRRIQQKVRGGENQERTR